MYKVEFQLNGINTIIQCRDYELMDNICRRFSIKAQINLDNYYFIYSGGNNLNKKLKLSQVVNEEDRKRKQMNILVDEIPDFKDNLNIENETKRKYFGTLNTQKNDNSNKYHRLLAENRNLSSRNLTLRKNLDTFKTTNERLNTQNKELDEENDKLSERNGELEEENEELKKKNKELTSEISKLTLDNQRRKSFNIYSKSESDSEENKKKLELIGLTYELGLDEKSRICTKYNLGYKCLIMHLIQSNFICSEKVVRAMLEVDRNDFAPENPYADRPIYIGYNVTISAPHMHAFALEYLSDYCTKGAKILDIGSGSGFLTVALSKMTNDTGTVVGIDHIPELYDFGRRNIKKNHSKLINNGKVILVLGDGRKGYQKYGPYKAIHVGACSEQVPRELLNQLDNNGRMFIPVGKKGENQNIYLVDKNSYGKVTYKSILSVCYGMLTDVKSQLNQ